MIHLKNTSVALRTVMASIGLSLEAPVADTHTTVLLFLDIQELLSLFGARFPVSGSVIVGLIYSLSFFVIWLVVASDQ